MKAIHHPAPRTGIGTDKGSGNRATVAATVDGTRHHGVSYGDVLKYRKREYRIIQHTPVTGSANLHRVTAVDQETWGVIRSAEWRAEMAPSFEVPA